jgi:hypothetical protein
MAADAGRRGYRHLLDAFWDEARSFGIPLPTEDPVSAPAFCQARAKVSSDSIRELLHEASRRFDSTFPEEGSWRGHRVLAVDGSKVNLQRSPELDQAFGRPRGAHCPQVLMSALVNVNSKVPVDVAIAPNASSERELLLNEHLPLLQPGDIVVLDRGYPSYEVIQRLLEAEVEFLMRVPTRSAFSAITDFLDKEGDDYLVTLEPPAGKHRDAGVVCLRAVRFPDSDGEDTVYLTSLRRCQGFTRSDLGQLYKMRWEAEEFFKTFKGPYLGQNQFHSKTAAGIQQEILAVCLFHSISRYFMAAAAETDGSPFHELSVKSTSLGLAAYVVRILLTDPDRSIHWLRQLLDRVARTRDKRRPGRSFPRRSFKPGRRWDPSGRRGA